MKSADLTTGGIFELGGLGVALAAPSSRLTMKAAPGTGNRPSRPLRKAGLAGTCGYDGFWKDRQDADDLKCAEPPSARNLSCSKTRSQAGQTWGGSGA